MPKSNPLIGGYSIRKRVYKSIISVSLGTTLYEEYITFINKGTSNVLSIY